MTAYYNEHDPHAAAWLRELIEAGHIAPGIVDERSIEDVLPSDLEGFTQCHFFAGVGVWSYALRRAGWPDDRPVWTGSCPCQPFSAAGKGAGFTDERHLWPAWFHLITTAKRRKVPVFGEQVASKDGYTWLDLVQTDLEEMEHTCWPVVLPAAGVGAPHERHRIFFVAESLGDTSGKGPPEQRREQDEPEGLTATSRDGRMADADQQQRNGSRNPGSTRRGEIADGGTVGRLADAELHGCSRQETDPTEPRGNRADERVFDRGHSTPEGQSTTGPINGLWRNADWLYCRDGKWRPVEPGTFPLVDGIARGVVPSSHIGMAVDANKTAEARTMRLKGYGNAINAEVATAFIKAYVLTNRP